jgi:Uma2 family endonuclease
MGLVLKKTDNTKWTYSDYLKWDDSHRYELIEGEAFDMSPAPLRRHQAISRDIEFILVNFFKDKECEVYNAPFDVRFPDFADQKDDEITTVLQPDIVVICDKSKLDDKGCKGAPNLVVEILSPWTLERDFRIKYNIYELYGVKEYWIVDPVGFVHLYCLKDKKFEKQKIYTKDERLISELFPDIDVELNEVFRI